MSAPDTFNFRFPTGSSVVQAFEYVSDLGIPIDLTGYAAKLQIVDGNNTAGGVLLTLTNPTGIALGGTAGTFSIVITKVQSATLLPSSSYLYDLRVTDPAGLDTYLIAGGITVLSRITT